MNQNIYIIEKLDHYGRGISHHDGQVIFIENAMLDEKVEIVIENTKKKYIEAKAKHIIEKNKNRQEIICPYYHECGGCNLLHMNYQEQIRFKENKLKDIFSKYIDEKVNINRIVTSENYYYRNKATFQVKEKIGYYKRKTYEIISIEKCLLVHPKINELLLFIQNNIPLEGIEQIMFRVGVNTNQTMILIKGNATMNSQKMNDLLKEKVDVLSLVVNNKYIYLTKQKQIQEKLGNYFFVISPSSFFQVNTKQTEKLYNEVLKHIDSNDHVLDLYCGTGTIGIYVSKIASQVVGVELNEAAIFDANENKQINHISNIEFLCQSVSKLKKKYKGINTIIVDPPRAGLDKKSIDYILDYQAEKMIYVSCDPMTLARDLNILKEHYAIQEITPVDMFPNTYHVECVCALKRR